MSEFTERVCLAWALLRDKDTALVKHVRNEIGRIDRDVVGNCVNIARVFSLEGHSGASASIVVPWIQKALSWEPVAPLTGEADEWISVAEVSGYPLWQNKRCGRVFREGDGQAYDTDGKVFREPDGFCYQSKDSRVFITFPYTPKTEYVDVPFSDGRAS